MENKVFKRRGRRKAVSFNPSHEYIQDSVQEFLKQGGQITRIETVKNDYQDLVATPDSLSSVDDFLLDR